MIGQKMGNGKETTIQLKCTKSRFLNSLISWKPHKYKGYTGSFKILSFSAGRFENVLQDIF